MLLLYGLSYKNSNARKKVIRRKLNFGTGKKDKFVLDTMHSIFRKNKFRIY